MMQPLQMLPEEAWEVPDTLEDTSDKTGGQRTVAGLQKRFFGGHPLKRHLSRDKATPTSFPFAVVSLGFIGVRLGTSRTDLMAPVTHQDQGLQQNRGDIQGDVDQNYQNSH